MRVVAAPDFPTLRESLARETSALRSADALAPVTVIVPSELARDEARRDLARRLGGTLAVRVVTLPRWIDDAAGAQIAREGGTHLSEAGFERLAARVLADRARRRRDGPLLESAGTPGASRLLAATLADLYEGAFDPQTDEIAPVVARDPMRRALPALFRDFDDALSRERWFDRRRRERTARDLLREAKPGGGGASSLFLLGFHDLTPVQRDLILHASRTSDVTLFVPGPSPEGAAGEAAAAPLLAWARSAGAALEVLARPGPPLVDVAHGLFGPPSLVDPGPARLELAAYATESEEVRAIAGRILDGVAEGERGFGDFLVTVPARGGPSPLLFRRVFASAGIPLHDAIGVPASRTGGGRAALVLARAQAAARDTSEASALEFLAPYERATPEAPAASEAFLRARDAAEIVARFRELHAARFAAPPSAEVDEALGAVALVHGTRPLRPRDFPGVLAAALEATRVHTPGERGGVLLATMDGARGVTRPVAFHAGLVRGAVRRAATEDPLLPDGMRRELSDLHAHRGRRLAVAEDRTEEQLLLARFAFGAGTELAVLSFAERDRIGGETRNPSGLLLDVASARAGVPLDPRSAEFLRIAPPRARERGRRRPVDATDLDLSLLGGPATPAEEDLARLLREPRARHLPRVLRAAEARWGEGSLGAWEGVLSDPRAIGPLAARVRGRRWSPTSLEALVNCPFAFLLKLLGLDEAGAEPDDFDPRDRGGLFHEIVERAYRTLLEGGRLPLAPASLPEAIALVDADIHFLDAALAAEPVLRRLHRRATLAELRNDVVLVLSREAHRPAEERTVPERFELAFGGEDDPPPAPALPLPGGAALPLRGKVDRVDRRADGALEIVDFKTGRVRGRSGAWRAKADGKSEVRLQLPLYLEALAQLLDRPVARALYYYATAREGFEEVTYSAEDLSRDRAEIARVLERAVRRASEGWFPCTPGAARCCFPRNAGACGPSVAERFRRKLADPELAEHVALVRGDKGEDAEAAP
ncbi:MAG: PD-(D/E)XK nuclease family protein [bacterium]